MNRLVPGNTNSVKKNSADLLAFFALSLAFFSYTSLAWVVLSAGGAVGGMEGGIGITWISALLGISGKDSGKGVAARASGTSSLTPGIWGMLCSAAAG